MDVAIVGDGDEWVVAVHGIQGTRAAWMPLAAHLLKGATLCLPNLRGRGLAFRGASIQDYCLDAFADDLAEVIEKVVGGRPYTLAGWSMGVSVALAYLARGTTWPTRLVLMSGTPNLGSVHWFESCDDDELRAEIVERERRLGLREAADHDAVALTWRAIRCSNQRPMLPSIDIPTLVVHGSNDLDSPIAHAQWLADAIKGARLEVIEGAGHSILGENTGTVAAAVRRFLSF